MAKLLHRMEAAGKAGEILPMHYVLKACTSEVITKYAFGDSFHFLDEEDYATPYMKATDVYHLFNHALPLPLGCKRQMWIEQVEDIRNSSNPEQVKSTIFEGVLNSKLPEEENSNARLAHEAHAALYQLLANPAEFRKVKAELAEAIPDPGQIPSFSQVENLPYFSAVVQEVLRIHPGIVSRLPRVSPELPIDYKNKRNGEEYVIPPGTPTIMTIQIAHMNPEAFEDPYEFRPQR
ncbi:MAG: hypothetical protein Q9187_002237 [Circinaria calcarea]